MTSERREKWTPGPWRADDLGDIETVYGEYLLAHTCSAENGGDIRRSRGGRGGHRRRARGGRDVKRDVAFEFALPVKKKPHPCRFCGALVVRKHMPGIERVLYLDVSTARPGRRSPMALEHKCKGKTP